MKYTFPEIGCQAYTIPDHKSFAINAIITTWQTT